MCMAVAPDPELDLGVTIDPVVAEGHAAHATVRR